MGKKAAVKGLRETQGALTVLVKKTEPLKRQFKRFSEDCIKKMKDMSAKCRKAESKRKVMNHYLKTWFHSFLAHKDEAMALWKGTLVRRYQIKDHKAFTPHDRGHENSYYKRSLALSGCSVDGINYEYRKLVDQYGESDSLDSIADANEANDVTLNEIIVDLDSNKDALSRALVELGASKVEIKISCRENKHMGEEILIYMGEDGMDDDDEKKQPPLQFTRNTDKTWQIESRAEALSSTLEDPEGDGFLYLGLERENTVSGGGAKHTSMVVMDQEDILAAKRYRAEQMEVEKAQAKRKLIEKEKLSMEVSLDEIKRAFGAQQLQSTFVRMDAEEWGLGPGLHLHNGITPPGGINPGSVGNGGSRETYDAPDDLDYRPAKTQRVDDENQDQGNTHNVNTSSSREGSAPSRSNKDDAATVTVNMPLHTVYNGLPLPVSRIVLARVLVPSPLLSRVGGQWLELPLSITSLASMQPQTQPPCTGGSGSGDEECSVADLVVSASDVLEEVYRRIWSRIVKKDGFPKHAPLPLLPRLVKVAAAAESDGGQDNKNDKAAVHGSAGVCHQYEPGAVFLLPHNVSSVFVVCHDQVAVTKTLTKVTDMVTSRAVYVSDGDDNDNGGGGVEKGLSIPSRIVLLRIAAWLEGTSTTTTTTSGSGGSTRPILDLSDLGLSLEEEGHFLLAALQRVCTSSSLAPSHLPIPLTMCSGSALDPTCLALLLLLSESVEANGLLSGSSSRFAGTGDYSCLYACGKLLNETLQKLANVDLGNSAGADDGICTTKASNAAAPRNCSSKQQQQLSSLQETWTAVKKHTALCSPPLSQLQVRYNSGMWLPPCSRDSSSSSSSSASLFFSVLLNWQYFPSLRVLDMSHGLSKKPMRSLNQAQRLLRDLEQPLLLRVNRRRVLLETAGVVEREAGEMPESVHLSLHGLRGAIRASGEEEVEEEVRSGLMEKRSAVEEQLVAFLEATASAAVVFTSGSLAVL